MGLTELGERGHFVGIAGNHTARAGRFIRELNLPADIIATSDDWGASKPSIEFFHKLIDVSGHISNQIQYASDRLDNDVSPAINAPRKRLATSRTVGHGTREPLGQVVVGSRVSPDLKMRSLRDLPATLLVSRNGSGFLIARVGQFIMQMSEQQREELDALIGPDGYDGSVSARAQMVLWNDAGLSVQDIARRSGASKPTVYKWLDRYQRFGIDGLVDLPRVGPPPGVPGKVRARIVALTRCTRRPILV